MVRRVWLSALLAAACVVTPCVHAAGGHHAVDDAAILDPRQCQIETWFDHELDGHRNLAHLGGACRVERAEVGLNLDHVTATDDRRSLAAGLQSKWAWAASDTLGVGAALSYSWRDASPHPLGRTVVIPATWQATRGLRVHVNVGHDFARAAPDASRGGVALEWAPSSSWSFVAERYREWRANLWRVGARCTLSPAVDVDLSRAQALAGRPAFWTVGLSWVFER